MKLEIMRERAVAAMWNDKAAIAKIAELFNNEISEGIDRNVFFKNERTRGNNVFLNSSVKCKFRFASYHLFKINKWFGFIIGCRLLAFGGRVAAR